MKPLHPILSALALGQADAYLVAPPGTEAPGATSACSNWVQQSYGLTCDIIEHFYGMSAAQFESWNPTVTQLGAGCNLIPDLYYCVQVNYVPNPTLTSTSTSTASTTSAVETCNPAAPSPTQPGVICGCNEWHKVESYTTCDSIYNYYSIDPADFDTWNPEVGLDCKSLWLGYYVCIGVDGAATVPTTTTTAPVETCNPAAPSPTQPGVTCGCNEWHVVASTTTCSNIYNYFGISPANFDAWNPTVGTDCSSLWVGYNVCVGVVPEVCNPEAPSPIQPDAVCGCTDWHVVSSRTTCSNIYSYYNIDPADFDAWNPSVGTHCSSLWAGYYVCIGVPGQRAHACNKDAPSPLQPDVVCGCKKWHLVASTTTCSNIYNYYNVSPADFASWNPEVGADCGHLWVGYNVCVDR